MHIRLLENKKGKGWDNMNTLTPVDLEINRHIDNLDRVAITYESKWGVDVLPALVGLPLAAKWRTQCAKLTDAIQRGDLPQVADLVAGCIRGYAALEAAAIANGHAPQAGTFLEARADSGTVYRIALTDLDARRAAAQGTVVYTMAEVIRILEPLQLINRQSTAPAATADKPRMNWRDGDGIPF